jgi:murein L,D-transpeptidase YafK
MKRPVRIASVLAGALLLPGIATLYGAHSSTAISVVTPPPITFQKPVLPNHEAPQIQQALARLNMRLQTYDQDYEARLLKALIYFKGGHPNEALEELNHLLKRAPHFHLAYLIRGDILMSRVRQVSDIGQPALLDTRSRKQQQMLQQLRAEAEARLAAHLVAVDPGTVPAPLLKLAPRIHKAVLVDKSRHRLYIYARQHDGEPPTLVRDFYVSTGKARGNKHKSGDLRTPEGVYFVTRYIPDRKLPEKYGIGAFPVNYPNALDKHLGKTGDGIWLHGTDRIYYSRPPLDSEGCVVLPNLDLSQIKPEIVPGVTPVIIADHVRWVKKDKWQQTRASVLQAIENWREDWQSLDVQRYLGHYAPGFWSGRYDRDSWARYKKRVAAGKRYQKVKLSNLSVFVYPRKAALGKDMVLVKFRQQYRSNNFNSETNKELLLIKQGDHWRILHEG